MHSTHPREVSSILIATSCPFFSLSPFLPGFFIPSSLDPRSGQGGEEEGGRKPHSALPKGGGVGARWKEGRGESCYQNTDGKEEEKEKKEPRSEALPPPPPPPLVSDHSLSSAAFAKRPPTPSKVPQRLREARLPLPHWRKKIFLNFNTPLNIPCCPGPPRCSGPKPPALFLATPLCSLSILPLEEEEGRIETGGPRAPPPPPHPSPSPSSCPPPRRRAPPPPPRNPGAATTAPATTPARRHRRDRARAGGVLRRSSSPPPRGGGGGGGLSMADQSESELEKDFTSVSVRHMPRVIVL